MLRSERFIAAPKVATASRLWNRTRVQLGGGLLFAVFGPFMVLFLLTREDPAPSLVQQTLVGILIALLLGYYLLRNITVFPGMRATYYIMPSFLVSYGLALAVFFFLRLDYSRSVFIGSFSACLFWYYLAYAMAQRSGAMRIAVVPFGQVSGLLAIDRVTWIGLSRPALDGSYDALVADFRADLPDEWEAFLAECAINGAAVFHVKQLQESLTGKVAIEHLTENSFGSLVPFLPYLKARRVADFLVALAAGILLLPFLLVIGLAIKIDSPGPALFRQRRVGYRGNPFLVAKFRTMNASSAGNDLDEAVTRQADPRITRLGRFLRRSRIDELPQIWNILKGDMSWIGPRPEAEVLSEWYQRELPFYRYRHIVPPGITGWAQVNQGHVAELDQVSHKLHYDFYYIKNFSPWLDLLILIRTVKTVLTGFGSK
jgi:lipopolysaccharide/colanic/teichoic acid biosynthesis glycosyltransferase